MDHVRIGGGVAQDGDPRADRPVRVVHAVESVVGQRRPGHALHVERLGHRPEQREDVGRMPVHVDARAEAITVREAPPHGHCRHPQTGASSSRQWFRDCADIVDKARLQANC